MNTAKHYLLGCGLNGSDGLYLVPAISLHITSCQTCPKKLVHLTWV